MLCLKNAQKNKSRQSQLKGQAPRRSALKSDSQRGAEIELSQDTGTVVILPVVAGEPRVQGLKVRVGIRRRPHMQPHVLTFLEPHRPVVIEELDDLHLRGRREGEVEGEDDGAQRVVVDVDPPVFDRRARDDRERGRRHDDLAVPPGGRVVTELVIERDAELRQLGRERLIVSDLGEQLVASEDAVEHRALQRHVGVHGVDRFGSRGRFEINARDQKRAHQKANLHGFLG